jgi:hypothetical protein
MVKKINNLEMLNIMELLRQLMAYEVPMDTAWNLKKNMKKLESLYKTFSEMEGELVQKYAIKDDELKVRYEENGQPKFAPANKEKFTKEQGELLRCVNEVDFLTIKYSDLRKIDKIKSAILFDLDFMIEDDTE